MHISPPYLIKSRWSTHVHIAYWLSPRKTQIIAIYFTVYFIPIKITRATSTIKSTLTCDKFRLYFDFYLGINHKRYDEGRMQTVVLSCKCTGTNTKIILISSIHYHHTHVYPIINLENWKVITKVTNKILAQFLGQIRFLLSRNQNFWDSWISSPSHTIQTGAP